MRGHVAQTDWVMPFLMLTDLVLEVGAVWKGLSLQLGCLRNQPATQDTSIQQVGAPPSVSTPARAQVKYPPMSLISIRGQVRFDEFILRRVRVPILGDASSARSTTHLQGLRNSCV